MSSATEMPLFIGNKDKKGKFHCPVPLCTCLYSHISSLRKHCNQQHKGIKVTEKSPEMTAIYEERSIERKVRKLIKRKQKREKEKARNVSIILSNLQNANETVVNDSESISFADSVINSCDDVDIKVLANYLVHFSVTANFQKGVRFSIYVIHSLIKLSS